MSFVLRNPTWLLSNSFTVHTFTTIWAISWQNQQTGLCSQRRLISAYVSAQSDQSLCCLHEETLDLKLPIECTMKILIRLGRCPGWFESFLGAQSCCWFCHEAAQFFFFYHVYLFIWVFRPCKHTCQLSPINSESPYFGRQSHSPFLFCPKWPNHPILRKSPLYWLLNF